MMRARIALGGVALAALLVVAAAQAGSGPRTTLTSIGPGDEQVTGSSTYWRSLSGDGRLALFTSDDDDLPGADSTRDVFVRDLAREKTILISRSTSGEAADDDSGDDPAVSADGRFVAFSSDAENLAGGVGGIFLRDLEKGTTKLVSKSTAGVPTSDHDRPVLSADGRLVSFESNDDDFPGADGTTDAYVRDRKTGKTSLVTQSTGGDPIDTNSAVYPSISGNGRFVAFGSDSDVLPGDDATGDAYIRDLKRRTTSLVSRTPEGDPAGNGLTDAGALSFDGRFVAFSSHAASLGADPTDSVFVRDRKLGTTKLASREGGGDAAIGYTASISQNGRYVAYESEDDDLPGLDGTTDIFRYDRQTKQTVLVSRSNGGEAGDDDSFYSSISGGGGFIAFSSRANNFSGADDNAATNAFVRGPLD